MYRHIGEPSYIVGAVVRLVVQFHSLTHRRYCFGCFFFISGRKMQTEFSAPTDLCVHENLCIATWLGSATFRLVYHTMDAVPGVQRPLFYTDQRVAAAATDDPAFLWSHSAVYNLCVLFVYNTIWCVFVCERETRKDPPKTNACFDDALTTFTHTHTHKTPCAAPLRCDRIAALICEFSTFYVIYHH